MYTTMPRMQVYTAGLAFSGRPAARNRRTRLRMALAAAGVFRQAVSAGRKEFIYLLSSQRRAMSVHAKRLISASYFRDSRLFQPTRHVSDAYFSETRLFRLQ